MKNLNERIVNVRITRHQLCDLLIACDAVYEASGAEKWEHLHDELEQILNIFDEEVKHNA